MKRDQHEYVPRRKAWTLIAEVLDLLVLLAVILGGAFYLYFIAP